MITQKPLFSWIFRRYAGLQLLLLAIVLVMVFARVFPLEMQKRIVNVAIRFKDYHSLYLYCALYLGAVVLAGSLKYLINVLQHYIGHKILLEIRSRLYDHILHIPLPFFRRTPSGMVISSITSELSTIGDFLGGALAVPVVNLLTLIAFGGYMIHLNPLLALLSLAIYPVEIAIIPYLQNRFNRLNRERIDTTRTMSNHIGEVVGGMQEVHGNGSYTIENRKFARFARELFRLRYRMSLIKFGIKFVNNFFQSLGPFILFLVGGYLTIQGSFDLGALVAFLSAYEKLYDPWKELMDYYQALQDARVRYTRVMEYFHVEAEAREDRPDRSPARLRGDLEVSGLVYTVDKNVRLLDQVSLDLPSGGQLALVGFSGSGKSTLAMVLGRIYNYDAGQVLWDGRELKRMSKVDLVHNIGFVPQHPFIFNGTLMENLLYGCEALDTVALKETAWDGGGTAARENAPQSSRVPDRETVLNMILKVGLFDDVLRLGLNSTLSARRHPELLPRLVRIRQMFYHQWGEQLEDLVEFFHSDRYLHYTDLGCNLTFGNANRHIYEPPHIAEQPLFQEFLTENGLMTPLVDFGKNLAQRTVTLLEDLRDDPFFFQKSPIPPEELDLYRELVEWTERNPLSPLGPVRRNRLLRLSLRFVAGEHKMVACLRNWKRKSLKPAPFSGKR